MVFTYNLFLLYSDVAEPPYLIDDSAELEVLLGGAPATSVSLGDEISLLVSLNTPTRELFSKYVLMPSPPHPQRIIRDVFFNACSVSAVCVPLCHHLIKGNFNMFSVSRACFTESTYFYMNLSTRVL